MSGFFVFIRCIFGYTAVYHIKQFQYTLKKIASMENRIYFLHKCKELNIIPTFVSNALKNIDPSFNNMRTAHKFRGARLKFIRTIINSHLNESYYQLNSLNSFKYATIGAMIDMIPGDLFNYIMVKNYTCHYSYKYKLKINADKKLMNIKNITLANSLCQDILKFYEQWIVNLSGICIDQRILAILSLGPKFAYNTKDKNKQRHLIFNTISNFMSTLKYSNIINKQELHNKVSKYLYSFNVKNTHQQLSCAELELLTWIRLTHKFINQNPHIIVTTADKGNKTVIMLRTDYESKALNVLNDCSTYKILKKNPVPLFDRKIRLYLKQNHLSHLIVQNPNTGLMYFKPKIHKVDIPLRQITSTIDTSCYKLSKFLFMILQQAIDVSNNNVKNSFQLINQLKEVKLELHHRLFSLDVTALYPSLPQPLVFKCIEEKWTLISQFTDLSLQAFLDGIRLCFDGAFFSHNSTYYLQIDGAPMGSSLSGALADLVLNKFEQQLHEHQELGIVYFTRYVDDCLLIAPEDKIDTIFNYVNKFHHRLKFTIEKEENQSINFLDTKIIRQDNKFITNWYRKPTSSGRYLNFHSYTNIKYKISVIYALTDRAILLASPHFHKENLFIVKHLLIQNSYPATFIDIHIKKRLITLDCKQHLLPIYGPQQQLNYCTIPYNAILNKAMSSLLRETSIRLANSSVATTSHIYTKLKDQITTMDNKNVIYEVTCGQCSKLYYGETSQPLKKRIKQHEYHCRLLNQYHSGLCRHHFEFGHKFKFNETRILLKEPDRYKRLVYESLYINIDPKNNLHVNNNTNFDDVATLYKPLLCELKL